MSAIFILAKNCLKISNAVSLLRPCFCGSGFSTMTFAAFTQPVEFVVAIH